MKNTAILLSLIFSTNLFAVCESAKLNESDTIYQGYHCTPTNVVGAKKMDNLCLIKAKTMEDEGKVYKYTHFESKAYGENGWKNYYSTFKWHHKKNDSVSKMWESKKLIKMKDVTPTDFLSANVYKVSVLNKSTKKVEIEVYKKKGFNRD